MNKAVLHLFACTVSACFALGMNSARVGRDMPFQQYTDPSIPHPVTTCLYVHRQLLLMYLI